MRLVLLAVLPVVIGAIAHGAACAQPPSRPMLRASSPRCCANHQPDLPGVRVNKVFTTKFSRREADRLVTDGRVKINGAVAAAGDRF